MTIHHDVQLDASALEVLKREFVERLPGFTHFSERGGNYPTEERDYKDALVALFQRTIDPSLFAAPIDQPQAERIADAVWRVLTAKLITIPQNLLNYRYYLFLSEEAFRQSADGADSAVVQFARAFGDLLYGPGDSAARLERFNGVMWPIWQRHGLAKAVTVSFPTFFLMLANPTADIYVRSRDFSRLCRTLVGHDVLTTGPFGAAEYRQIQDISHALFDALTGWGWQPRDMIDVQGFVYTTQAPAADYGTGLDTPSGVPVPASTGAFDRILASLRSDGLYFPPELVANYLLALQAKRFVILTGISGTGKTKMAMAVADSYRMTREQRTVVDAPEGAFAWTVNPSALTYGTMIVPAVVARRLQLPALDERNGAKVPVRFADQAALQRIWRSPNDGTVALTHSGPMRAWFRSTLKSGDVLYVDVIEDEDGEPTGLQFSVPRTTVTTVSLNNRLVVPVRPDWTDNRGLLGWYNPITERYHSTAFLEFLLDANAEFAAAADAGRVAAPYFVILDEMNLARVEHYFSDFLSAMESGEPIPLHDDEATAGGEREGRPIPRALPVPPNLFITGTVNVDETTYMFSPKVLDRAFTIEFNDVDLPGLGRTAAEGVGAAAASAEGLTLPGLGSALVAPGSVGAKDWAALGDLVEGELSDIVLDLHAALTPTNRHFGYRVANEIGRYMWLAVAQTDGSAVALRSALDLALLAKVLPKLQGTQAELGDLIDTLARRADIHALPRTLSKLGRMRRRLETQGFTSFIE